MNTNVDALISSTLNALQKFHASSSTDDAAAVNDRLSALVRVTSTVDPTARLSMKNPNLVEILSYCPSLLSATTTSSMTRSRLHLLLFNLSFYNVNLRRYLAGEKAQLCGPVLECLKLSLKEQLGPQNLIDILRLLQVLTYESCLCLGCWASDLISFLLSEICRPEEPEWMPYCMAILCNLATKSKSVCQRIKKSTSYKAFSHKLLKLLAHDSRIVVVSSLVLVGYLEEKLRDTVFCSRNIPQTFQCIFNVLIIGDCLMTRHIATDLLIRLVVSDSSTVSSVPSMAPTGKSLTSYPYFERSVQQIANLLLHLDARTEEATKIYDIFLAFCSLHQMRTPTALAVLKCPPTEERLTTPLLSVCTTAQMTFDEAIIPEAPLKAVRLLRYLLKEAIENGSHVEKCVSSELILRLIENNVKTAVETGNDLVSFQCRRISEGLRLAECISSDDDFRAEVLNVVNAPLCAHVIEFQMISNPVVAYISRVAAQRTEALPDWSSDGVIIVLDSLRVLAALKDHSKSHKDEYWKFLKDERLIPFIAYSVAQGTPDMTYNALLLFTHCAQVQDFPTRWLADLTANCTEIEIKYSCDRSKTKSSSRPLSRCNSDYQLDSGKETSSYGGRKTPSAIDALNGDAVKEVDELLDKMKRGMDLKDARLSQLIGAFERKISLLKIEQRGLEDLLTKKDDELRQCERLRLLRQDQDNEVELSTLQLLLGEYEEKLATLKKELEHNKQEKLEINNCLQEKIGKVEALNEMVAKLNQEKNVLSEENKFERDFSTLTKTRYDELKANFDTTSSALIEKNRECVQLIKENTTMKTEVAHKSAEVESLKDRLKQSSEEKFRLEDDHRKIVREIQEKLEERDRELERLSKEFAKINKFKDKVMRMVEDI